MQGSDVITKFLSGKLVNPLSGKIITSKIKLIKIEANIINNINDYLQVLDSGTNYLLVCDNNTYQVAGKDLVKQISKSFAVKTLNLGTDVLPTESFADIIIERASLDKTDLVIAVGSGSINDLCKYVACKLGIDYIVFATAPSMNGYISPNASIYLRNYFSSVFCQPPIALFMDLDILSCAPMRLIRSGIGDCFCRTVSQADLILANILRGDNYDTLPFDISIEHEKYFLDNPQDLVNRDQYSIFKLCELLILNGIAMYMFDSSIPTSQSEHMLVKTMHMLDDVYYSKFFHGEEIAVASILMLKAQAEVLSKLDRLEISDFKLPSILKYFDYKYHENISKTYDFKKKYDSLKIKYLIDQNKTDITSRIECRLSKCEAVTKLFLHIGLFFREEKIQWSDSRVNLALRLAKYTRDRFTFLDLM